MKQSTEYRGIDKIQYELLKLSESKSNYGFQKKGLYSDNQSLFWSGRIHFSVLS